MTRIEAIARLEVMLDRLRATADHTSVSYDPTLGVFANYGTPRDEVDELRRVLDVNVPRLDQSCLRYKNGDGSITVFVSEDYCEPDLLANREVQVIECQQAVEIGGAA